MKRVSLIVLGVVLVSTMAWAQESSLSQGIGGYVIELVFDRLPARVGENTTILKVTDGSGKVVTGATATIEVLYFMREGIIPGKGPVVMPYMAYIAEAVPKDSMYVAKLNLWMDGAWNLFVTVTDNEKKVTGRFHLHVVEK